MQPMADVSMNVSPPEGMQERAKTEPPAGATRVTQRRLVYYSDFDLSLSEWRAEYECIQTYSIALRKSLGTIITFRLTSRRGMGAKTRQRASPNQGPAQEESYGCGARVSAAHPGNH